MRKSKKTIAKNSVLKEFFFGCVSDMVEFVVESNKKNHYMADILLDFCQKGVYKEKKTHEDIISKANNGCSEYFNKLVAASEGLNIASESKKKKYVYDFSGMSLDVSQYCSGNAECFINRIDLSTSDFVDIMINVSAPEMVTNAEYLLKSIKIASLIDNLESNGKRCRVIAVSKSTKHKAEFNYSVNCILKDYSDVYYQEQMAFMLATPALFRYFFISVGASVNGDMAGSCYADKDYDNEMILNYEGIYIPSFYSDLNNNISHKNDKTILETYKHLS